jgi:hypothetical protein
VPASFDYRFDWNDNGNFTNTGDDMSQRIRPGLTTRIGRDQLRALSPIAVGTADFEINNMSRDYYPENASSPIYPNVLPAREIRVQATLSGVVYTPLRGVLDDFDINPDPDVKTIKASAVDALNSLKDTTATTALYPSIRTGDAIAAVLDAIGWPANARDLDSGATTLRWWALNGADAWTAIQDLVAAEGPPALLAADGTGSIVFRDRHHRYLSTLNSNPGFEGTTTPWVATGGALALNTSLSVKGKNSGQLTPTGAAALSYLSSEYCAVAAGARVTATGWFRCAASRNVLLNVSYFDATFTYLGITHTTTKAVTANTWNYVLTEYTAPASTAYAQIQTTMDATPPASHVLQVDEVRLQAASAAVATFRDAGAEPLFSRTMTYDPGWRDVVNNIQWDVDERGPDEDISEIWTSDQTYSIVASGSLSIEFSTSDPFMSAVISEFTLLSGTASYSLSATQGLSASVDIFAGGGGATIGSIVVTGRKVSVQRTLQAIAHDSTSISDYGSKAGPSSPGAACFEDALAVATQLVQTRKDPLPIVSITLAAVSDVRLAAALVSKLSDRIKIIDVANTGLNRDFWIEQIEHVLGQAPQLTGMRTTLGCEAVPTFGLGSPSTAFRFDHPTNGKFGTGTFAT